MAVPWLMRFIGPGFGPHEICGQSGTGTDFPPSISVFRPRFHSTNAPHSSAR